VDAKFERIIQHLKIDFSTGDKITPEDIRYGYKSMFDDEMIYIQAYNLETIIAEKYETVLSRGEANTRMRDFYDLYVLKTLKYAEIDFMVLRTAVENTAIKRNTQDLLEFADEIIYSVQESNELLRLWNTYRETYTYANHIEYVETVEAIKWIYDNVS
jgi:predicted nucleotidyltransferase component of viral defense system